MTPTETEFRRLAGIYLDRWPGTNPAVVRGTLPIGGPVVGKRPPRIGSRDPRNTFNLSLDRVQAAWDLVGQQAFDDAVLVDAEVAQRRPLGSDVWKLTGLRQPRSLAVVVERFGTKARDGSLVVGNTAKGVERMRDRYDALVSVDWSAARMEFWTREGVAYRRSSATNSGMTVTNVALGGWDFSLDDDDAPSVAVRLRGHGIILPGRCRMAEEVAAMRAGDGVWIVYRPNWPNGSLYWVHGALKQREQERLASEEAERLRLEEAERYRPTAEEAADDEVLEGVL